MAQPVLFSLVPQNEAALAIIDANPTYAGLLDGLRVLSFSLDRPSKTAGRLVSFGRHENNDIRLPYPSGGRRPQNYRNEHFFFYLAPSGELILRDLTPRLTSIEVLNVTADEQRLYQLQGSPRQRVIPRVNRRVDITFGTSTYFIFVWRIALNGANVQDALTRHARLLAASGMSMTIPNEENEIPARYELRSRYTPSVASQRRTYRSCHKYSVLGTGTFGIVFKAVDLSSGEIWAVKEIKAETRDDRWRAAFKREVEIIAHSSWIQDGVSAAARGIPDHSRAFSNAFQPYIVQFETFQDFCIGGRFQHFFRLCKGSLQDLLPQHYCIGPLPNVPAWLPQLIDHVLGALQYLHEESMILRDIKPANILYDYIDGDLHPTFYVADFGLATKEAEAVRSGQVGTLTYMPPEVALFRNTLPVSDIWSFAITLGCVLGYWCHTEVSMRTSDWHNKLQTLGSSEPYQETQTQSPMSLQKRWYFRIASLVEYGILPSMFTHMPVAPPHRASPAACLMAPKDDFVKRPQIPLQTNSEWHIKGLHVNDMSIDLQRGGY